MCVCVSVLFCVFLFCVYVRSRMWAWLRIVGCALCALPLRIVRIAFRVEGVKEKGDWGGEEKGRSIAVFLFSKQNAKVYVCIRAPRDVSSRPAASRRELSSAPHVLAPHGCVLVLCGCA